MRMSPSNYQMLVGEFEIRILLAYRIFFHNNISPEN